MASILGLANVLLPVAYLLLWLGYVWDFRRDDLRAARWTRGLTAATILIHLVWVVARTFVKQRLPLGSPIEFCSLMALALLLVYVAVERQMRVRQTGFLVVGLALVLQVVASAFMTDRSSDHPLLHSPGFAGHAVFVLLAYTALSVSFLYAVLYLVLSRQLARRRFGLLFRRLPPLDTLERMSVRATLMGALLLLVGLVLGHWWMHVLAGQVDNQTAEQLRLTDPKIVASWAIFLGYSLGLVGHRYLGWRGRRMNIVAIVAFVIVILVVGVIHHFLPSFHDFSLREHA